MTTPFDISGATIVVENVAPVPMMVLYIPQNNDVIVTVSYPGISDGTGATSEFYYKTNRTTSDTDPTTRTYTSPIVPDPDNAGACMSSFEIPAADNASAGSFWWRIDLIDSSGDISTVGYGTLMVESV
jgi:hypothetical protein